MIDNKSQRVNASGNPVKSVAHTLSGVRSILRSLPARVDLEEFDTPDLRRLAELHDVIEQTISECVKRMREQRDDRGVRYTSWSHIGRELGMTRQAAQQRFSRQGSLLGPSWEPKPK
jgi:hypothetical protein